MPSTTTADIESLLGRDHRAVAHVLGLFTADRAEWWPATLDQLTALVVAHEAAEEAVVYPALRRMAAGAGGAEGEAEATLHERLAEQRSAEEELAALHRLTMADPALADGLQRLGEALLAHAEAEERTVFPLLRALPAGARAELAAAYEGALERGPTHPHPHAPDTPPGNRILDPVAAAADRVRDAVPGTETEAPAPSSPVR